MIGEVLTFGGLATYSLIATWAARQHAERAFKAETRLREVTTNYHRTMLPAMAERPRETVVLAAGDHMTGDQLKVRLDEAENEIERLRWRRSDAVARGNRTRAAKRRAAVSSTTHQIQMAMENRAAPAAAPANDADSAGEGEI